jgi:tRNA dimethylallyltransferase
VLATVADRPIEIVSADSMQVYRGMDIGTAKPDPALRSRIPHHLIDIRDPDEPYDVGAFVHDADLAIAAIHDRGRLPVVAGGTGYYFRHLLFGLPETPPADPEVRAVVSRELERSGPALLHERLQSIDPLTAARIGVNDGYRIARALEVYEQTGRPLSTFTMTGPARSDLDVESVVLTRPRAIVRERIAVRVAGMFADGLRAEVERLVADGYGPGDPGLRAIGYREFFDDAGCLRPAADDQAIAARITVATRRYAKRQQTFVRQLPDLRRLDADDTTEVAALTDSLVERLHRA